MGKGRRNTARTGDKAMYNSRMKAGADSGGVDSNVITSAAKGRKKNKSSYSDDNVYDEIDQYHNDRDDENFLRLKDGNDDDDSEDDAEEKETTKALMGHQEHVLDLGLGGGSDDDSDSDDDDSESSGDDEDAAPASKRRGGGEDDDDDDSSEDDSDDDSEVSDDSEEDSDDDDDDDEDDDDDILGQKEEERLLQQQMQMDPRNWGAKKSMYYHGDTADLEIGQDEVDAYEEEEAAKEVQASRYEQMDEDDFALSDDNDDGDVGDGDDDDDRQYSSSNKASEMMQTKRDTSKLSQKDARKLLKKQYPELLPMVSYFSDIVKDLVENTDVATKALFESEAGTAESVGATKQGQQYLLTKAMLQKSIALNSVMYLLVRSTTSGGEDGLMEIQSHPVMSQLKSFNSMLQKFENQVEKKVDGIDKQVEYLVKAAVLMQDGGGTDGDDSSDDSESPEEDIEEQTNDLIGELQENQSSEDEEEEEEEEKYEEEMKSLLASRQQKQQQEFQNTLNDARFGLRPSEAINQKNDKRKRKHDSYADDFGDMDGDENPSFSSKALASTINTIEQRSDSASRKRRPAPIAEELDELDDEADDQLAHGIKLMEEEMGKLDDMSDEETGGGTGGKSKKYDMDDDEMDDEMMQFYKNAATKSKTKKSIKKGLYAVSPKFPRKDAEIDGERAISRAILKNRGLVAHKAKINRNPRVKKREQYRKALIRRKGAVREVREDEGHRYGGEETGIKSGISRSRKLSSK